GERRRVFRHFALGNDAALVRVHEFDRLFDRDDVPGEVDVNVVQQRRERGRLAGTSRARYQHQATTDVAELFDDRGNPELLQRGDLRRNETEDTPEALSLLQEIAAKPRVLIHLVSEIQVPVLDEAIPAISAGD